jgi:hypothetical protein
MSKITIQNQDRFIELESYRNFLKEKEELRLQYPNKPWQPQKQGRPTKEEPYEGWWEEWLEYKSKLSKLMFCTDCNFQQFLWDIKEERDEVRAQRVIKGIKRSIYFVG